MMNVVIFIVMVCWIHYGSSLTDEEQRAKNLLKEIDSNFSKVCTKNAIALWEHATDLTDVNQQRALETTFNVAQYEKDIWKMANQFQWQLFQDPDLRRQFRKYAILGSAVLPDDELKKFENLVSEMETIYSKAKICDMTNTKCNLSLEPDLFELMASSRHYDELEDVWTKWREKSGKPIRTLFRTYVDYRNKIATLNNFTDNTEYWIHGYESPTFKRDVERIWGQMKPLYLQLHAYVRRRLREFYGSENVSKTGPIPAHLLGNMWAQTWNNILDITDPFPNKQSMDVTPQMKQQGYTPKKMFQVAEEFFTSLNLQPMPAEFWEGSVIEKLADQEMICHPSAWDFCNKKDYRIKQCTRVNMEDLISVHHEMGHIQYFLQYRHQPLIYRGGANPGFQEAVGDLIALSVLTPDHLHKIGLLHNLHNDLETDLKYLYLTALNKIAFLPFGYLVDLWRWDIFSNKVTPEEYNCQWWKYRLEYQGIKPPNMRTEEDFDAGAKFHVAADVSYIRYFVSYIIQFQFHKALCIAADQYDPDNPTVKPLHRCDIYRSAKAGQKLAKMLQLGSSKPAPEAFYIMTGSRHMDASAILEYFQPLHKWLEEENARNQEYIGWTQDEQYCTGDAATHLLQIVVLFMLLIVSLTA